MKTPSIKNLFRMFAVFLIVAIVALPISGMAYYEAQFMLAAMGTLYSGLIGFALYCLFRTLFIVFLIMGGASMFLSQACLGFAIFYWLQDMTGMSRE